MKSVACDGTWSTVNVTTTSFQTKPVVTCAGTLVNVDGGGPFGLPPITYTEANALLGAIGALLALVWVIRRMASIIK